MSASRIFPAGLVLAVSLPSPALVRLGLARLDDNPSTPDSPGWLVVRIVFRSTIDDTGK